MVKEKRAEIDMGQVTESLVSQDKEFRFHSECNRRPPGGRGVVRNVT